jgi:UDP-N-acetylmuramyl pentapeptide synthase
MQIDTKILQEKYNALPASIRQAIDATETVTEVQKISDDFDLLYDQEDILSKDIAYVMLGVVPSVEFVDTIAKDLLIEKERALEIAKAVNSQILDKIRASIQVIQEKQQDTTVITPKKMPVNVLEALKSNDTMADHMLNGAVSKPMTTTNVAPIDVSVAPTKPEVDPYREPIM